MYSELFDQLGAGRRLQRENANAGHDNASNEPVPLVSFKAGKMELKQLQEPVASPSFQCEAIKTRGEVRLVWKENALKWQWYDRRDRKVRDEYVIATADASTGSTFERVVLTDKAHEKDRIYVWTRYEGPTADSASPQYHMYWMQDANEEKDDEIVASVNQYLADPQSAAPETSEHPHLLHHQHHHPLRMDNRTSGASSSSTATHGETANHQVDALSSILENLGMPQSSDASATSSNAATASGEGGGSTVPPRATLTLADLQGAMAGIQQLQQQPTRRSTGGVALSEVVTPEAITALLQNEAACQRLMELLPEEQRTREHLEDNLRSPQVQQTLRNLTASLLPDVGDGDDDWSGLYSVLANFQLDPADGQEAIASGNPIQAFLDCIIRSVEKEQHQMEQAEEGKEEGKEE